MITNSVFSLIRPIFFLINSEIILLFVVLSFLFAFRAAGRSGLLQLFYALMRDK